MTQLAHKSALVTRARRVVVKIGSGVLTDGAGLRRDRLEALAAELAAVLRDGREVVVVTSGAVAAGVARLELPQRPRTIPHKQAAAAVGQIGVMAAYDAAFGAHGLRVAQLLLTRDDFSNRHRYLNAKHAMGVLLEWRVVPIVNENDTVVVDEIKLGDNDNLSALTAALVEADLLIILSDVAGLYTADPRRVPDAAPVPLVTAVTPDVEAMAGDGGPLGTGGMATKLAAAKKAAASGIATVIADGTGPRVVDGGARPGAGDRHARAAGARSAREPQALDRLHAEAGRDARGRRRRARRDHGPRAEPPPLRPARGARCVRRGACVHCVGLDGREFARGLVNYGAAELDKIKGRHSREIEATLGYKVSDEIIHRDDLVVVQCEQAWEGP